MKEIRLVASLLTLALTAAACSSASYIAPTDPQYARSGAPRTSEPPLPKDGYNRIGGPDGESGSR